MDSAAAAMTTEALAIMETGKKAVAQATDVTAGGIPAAFPQAVEQNAYVATDTPYSSPSYSNFAFPSNSHMANLVLSQSQPNYLSAWQPVLCYPDNVLLEKLKDRLSDDKDGLKALSIIASILKKKAVAENKKRLADEYDLYIL